MMSASDARTHRIDILRTNLAASVWVAIKNILVEPGHALPPAYVSLVIKAGPDQTNHHDPSQVRSLHTHVPASPGQKMDSF